MIMIDNKGCVVSEGCGDFGRVRGVHYVDAEQGSEQANDIEETAVAGVHKKI